MTCEVFNDGKVTAIICGKRSRGTRCGFCQRIGTKLCDAIVGKTLGGDPITCDAPICNEHARQVGPDKDACPKHSM